MFKNLITLLSISPIEIFNCRDWGISYFYRVILCNIPINTNTRVFLVNLGQIFDVPVSHLWAKTRDRDMFFFKKNGCLYKYGGELIK